MCTVTIVPEPNGFCLVCNRDERRDRMPADPPRLHAQARCSAIYPVDPQGGGTWIGVNDQGLAAALLNRSCSAQAGAFPFAHSRGRIIPPLLRHDRIEDALQDARGLQPAAFLPFRLLLTQRRIGAEVASDGHTLQIQKFDLLRPYLATSSSLGDALVDGPRRRLFTRMFRRPQRWRESQEFFHRHQWRACPEWSVLMARRDARTVSRTCVRVEGPAVRMRYEAIG